MEETSEQFEQMAITGDYELDLNTLKLLPCFYTDIITEFADVEIFLISVDSLLLELCAHQYHNWILGGQTIVLCEQVKQFLDALEELNAKFKLIVFSELGTLFQQDTFLAFLQPFLLTYLSTSKWADNMETFNSPLDTKWDDFLQQLTPSFMLMSLENAPRQIFPTNINFSSRFVSLAFYLINESIPVVLFNGFAINFTSVMAFRIFPIPIGIENFEKKIAKEWSFTNDEVSNSTPTQIMPGSVDCKSITDFWTLVVREELRTKKDNDDGFQYFCIAAILSAMVCIRLGITRSYMDTEEDRRKGTSPIVNEYRRQLLSKARQLLNQWKTQQHSILFPLEDLWDGRMVYIIHKKIVATVEVLPLCLQEEFANLHKAAGLRVSVPTDLSEKLLDPITPNENSIILAQCLLHTIQNDFLNQYIPELNVLVKSAANYTNKIQIDYANEMVSQLQWKFKPIRDPLLMREEQQREKEKRELADPKTNWRVQRARQTLSKWYQLFSDSLEGQGGQLLVDFSRVVKMPTIAEQVNGKETGVIKKSGKKEGGKPGSSGGKKGVGTLSKKEQILKQNIDAKNKLQVESDKQKIEFITKMKTNTLIALDELMRRLDLEESKALCMYQKVIHYADTFTEQLAQCENLEQKRESALGLVESIKAIFVKYFKYLSENQREMILYYWVSLGFGALDSVKRRPDKQMDLQINLVYYQLQYGGRMIDVLSDPQKDDRVTGFWPDAWQRRMLDAVDQDKSALIVAPTSAGKTFVSYYCIEKVLRKSNDDVVVYISPSKALTNQIVGSVYARFRNKAMSGGKVLYGIFNNEIVDNPLNCQVLVTIPDSFEQILLSTDTRCQSFVSRIKYVILDEVHCINQKDTQGQSLGHIWEHIFLLIRCPFLALSATISNYATLREWLQTAEKFKPIDGTAAREVQLITYDERWSELELALQRIRDCPRGLQFENEEEQLMRGASVASNYKDFSEMEDREGEFIASEATEERTNTPVADGIQPIPANLSEDIDRVSSLRSPALSEFSIQSKSTWNDIVHYFSPFAIYKLEKLRMFGIPDDQRLTARQVLELFQMMNIVDPCIKEEFEPIKFFKKCHVEENAEIRADGGALWINRVDLRQLESALKNRFVQWMNEDKNKIKQIFSRLESDVKEEFQKRSVSFNMRNSALYNVMPLIDQLKQKGQIPALCFNDDREICEQLAIRVFNEFQKREDAYKISPEFQRRYNFKAHDKALKIAKRKRDEEERAAKRKRKQKDEEGNKERFEKEDDSQDTDMFALLRMKMREDLERFKLFGQWSDEDIYNKCVENLSRKRDRRSTLLLLRLFERGIGFHHDGLSNAERSAVEVLFRRGFLGIVFSTSTLALGMNLPCKTVIFGIDTPKLTPLQFRQMSGRAGRRGYDPAGTVIFMSLPTSKIRRLLTASLATLRGNVPFTTAFMLRLFVYVNGQSIQESIPENTAINIIQKTNIKAVKTGAGVAKYQSFDTTNVAVRERAALTLLEAPFILKTRKEHNNGIFKNLLKFLTFFNVQLLRRLQLLDENCSPRGFAPFAVYLSNYDPGNLLFVRLLQEGMLHRYIKAIKKYDLTHEDDRTQAKDDLICILAHIFTNKFIPIHAYTDESGELISDPPVLIPLYEDLEKFIQAHNKEVDQLLFACLQRSSINHQIENPIFALSGFTKNSLQYSTEQLNFVPMFDRSFQLDERLIPMVSLRIQDHRGRKIYKNSYALDFWRNPNPDMLRIRNKLSVAERWYLINDFNKLLNDIARAIEVIAPVKDDLYKLFVGDSFTKDAKDRKEMRPGIAEEFDDKFRTAFKMKRRLVEETTANEEKS